MLNIDKSHTVKRTFQDLCVLTHQRALDFTVLRPLAVFVETNLIGLNRGIGNKKNVTYCAKLYYKVVSF